MTVVVPRTLPQALAVLNEVPDAEPLAGGTDLMVAVNAGRHAVGTIVAIGALPELAGWRREGGEIVLGGGLTYTQMADPVLAAGVPALAQAARSVGSPQIRNAGTLGGNLATASPAGDTLPVLLALDATIELASVRGTRTVPIADFLVGPKRTTRQRDEVIVAARVPLIDGPQEFLKVGARNAMVIAVANVAVVADADARTVRVAMGSVGPTALRAPEAEAVAAGLIDWSTLTLDAPDHGAAFSALVSAAARPIDDHRSTADYRRHCVGVLAARALRRLFPTATAAGLAA